MALVNLGLDEFHEEEIKEITYKLEWMRKRKFRLISSVDELASFVDEAIKIGLCAADTETTGLNTRPNTDKLVGAGFCYDSGEGIYIPTGHIEGTEYNLPEKPVLDEIKRLAANCVLIFHNAKYDRAVFQNYGIIIDQFDKFEDTLILCKLFDAGRKEIGLKPSSEKLLNQPMIDFETMSKSAKRLDLISPKIAYIYGAQDPICTLDLYKFLIEQDTVKNQRAIYNLEKRCSIVVLGMEQNHIRVDIPHLEKSAKEVEETLGQIKQEMFNLAGKEFNISSSKQLGEILFNPKEKGGLGYRYPMGNKKTATGLYFTDNSVMEKIKDEYPIVSKLIKYRGLEKSLGTYIRPLLDNKDDQYCVKLSFNQSGTDTGRFSSPGGSGLYKDGYSGVNVQSIPKSYEAWQPDLRKAFRARPGCKLVAIDYSAEEMRVAANLSREPIWIKAFLEGADLHLQTARLLFGSHIKKEDPERQIGKCVARGTLIASEKGWVPIETLKKGDKVLTHTGTFKVIDGVWDMGVKPGKIIYTRSGHKISCGLNHRFFTTNNEWVRATDLKPGDILKIINCDDMGSTELKRIHFNLWSKGNNNFISDDLPYIEISPLLGRLIGYVLGDGHIHNYSVTIVCSPKYGDVKNDIIMTAKKLGLSVKSKLVHRKEAKNPLWTISLSSTILVRFFNHIGFYGRREGKHEKGKKIFRVPRIIFESPKIVQREFLSGLFETDGTVDLTRTSVTTKDRELAEDLILLLVQFGIKAYIVPKESKRYNRMYYQVCFGREGSDIFAAEIGFISELKKNKLNKLITKKKLSTSQTIWKTEVKEIIPVDSMNLMDLTVSDDHTYVAQGLITHNTLNFQTLYGAGAKGIAQQAGISERESKKILISFFEKLPDLKKWMEREVARARKLKYVRTAMGRIRPLERFYNSNDDGLRAHADRCAVNFLIQGVCADIMKTTMVRVYNWITANNLQDEIKILITMHDELVYEMPEDKMHLYIPILYHKMKLTDILQGHLEWPVPLILDAEYGDTWHSEKDFFEENPELLNAPLPELPSKITINSTSQSGLPSEKKLDQKSVSENNVQETSYPEPDPNPETEHEVTDNPEEVSKDTIETSADESGKKDLTFKEPLIYTIRDTRKSTLRRINDILDFLRDEDKQNHNYLSPRQEVRLVDRAGNILSINIKANHDTFLSVMRYEGL